jgi:aminoglycoside phosphotransferase (APT) family kinase protein
VLSPADYRLVCRDPDLPGLSLLLNEATVAEILQERVPDLSLHQIRKTYIRYKPATSCLIGYELNIGKPVQIYAKAFANATASKLKKYQQRLEKIGENGLEQIVLENVKTIVSPFPHDYQLTQLTSLLNPRSRQQILQSVLPSQPDLRTAALQGLRYKPERRYVAKFQSDEWDQAIIKAYTRQGYQSAKRNAEIWQSIAPSYTIPISGHSSAENLLIFPWVEGRPLSDLLNTNQLTWDVLAQTGAILAQLHQQNPLHLPPTTRTDEATHLLTLASDLSWLCPQWTKRIQTIAVHLATHLLQLPVATCPIHGDFNAEQVLLHADGITLIDFDRSACGDPATDLGSFIAKLHWRELREQLTATDREQLASSLIAGYCTGSPHLITNERVQSYTAIGLLRLASEPFRSGEKNWIDQINAILQRVEAILQHLSESLNSSRSA